MASSSSSSQNVAGLDSGDLAFVEIMASMGISEFDPLVPCALNDYCRKFATELLGDAKDYASYVDRSEITVDDINLALKLSDTRVMGVDPKDTAIDSLKDKINSQDMTFALDENQEFLTCRYPQNMFLEQTQTYAPGWEAHEKLVQNASIVQSNVVIGGNSTEGSTTGNSIDPKKEFKAMSISGTQYAKKLDSAKGF
jgi:histone H3/H4